LATGLLSRPIVSSDKFSLVSLSDGNPAMINSRLICSCAASDTVTNQAIGAFTELGLPYIKKWVADYRGQKKDRDAGKKTGYEMSPTARRDPQEKSFLQKVERELALVDYSNFTG